MVYWIQNSINHNKIERSDSIKKNTISKKCLLTFTVSDKVYQPYTSVPDCPSASTVSPTVDKRTVMRGTATTNCPTMEIM